jgi:PAS domain S-box-containing protein
MRRIGAAERRAAGRSNGPNGLLTPWGRCATLVVAEDEELRVETMTDIAAQGFATGAVQETLLGQALEHAPVGVVVFDEFGSFLAANLQAASLCGYTRQEFLALGSARWATEGVRTRLEEAVRGGRTHGRASIRRKDESPLEIEYRVAETRVGILPFQLGLFWPAEPA